MSLKEVEIQELERLDKLSKKFQKQGDFLQALEHMEQGLVIRQHLYGSESEIVWAACKSAGELCNLLAMTYLQQDDFDLVLELLKKAEILTERDPGGRATTYNNFACYYRRKGKLHSALQYLQKSLKIESRLTTAQNPADTHINACAVLSQLGRHQAALEHAQTSLIFLQDELLSPVKMGIMEGSTENSSSSSSSSSSSPSLSLPSPPPTDRIAVLAIAYHNIGVEQEFLKQYDASVISYQKGVEVAERYLGEEHPITVSLSNSLIAAKKSAEKAIEKATEKALNKSTSRDTRGGGGLVLDSSNQISKEVNSKKGGKKVTDRLYQIL